jgi:SAM-dependent methyltransferase
MLPSMPSTTPMPAPAHSRKAVVDLDALARALRRPFRFAPHDAPFWNDPYIAQRMLEAHLDPAHDAASRRPEVVERTVAHLVAALRLVPGHRLLDLGCGPGLYAIRFARLGLDVSGIDLSDGSITYARAAAHRAGVPIDYQVADYTRAPLGGPFDAAVLIYLDFGVLDDAGRDAMLDAVQCALVPGGRLAFDVKAPARARVADGSLTVERSDGGFWRPGPHLVIETTWRYDADLDLTQVAVVEPDATVTIYRIWDRAYGSGELRRLLARHGFTVEATWEDLGGSPFRRRSPTVAVVARRRVPGHATGRGVTHHQQRAVLPRGPADSPAR